MLINDHLMRSTEVPVGATIKLSAYEVYKMKKLQEIRGVDGAVQSTHRSNVTNLRSSSPELKEILDSPDKKLAVFLQQFNKRTKMLLENINDAIK